MRQFAKAAAGCGLIAMTAGCSGMMSESARPTHAGIETATVSTMSVAEPGVAGIDSAAAAQFRRIEVPGEQADVARAIVGHLTERGLIVDTADFDGGFVAASALGGAFGGVAYCGDRVASSPVDGLARLNVVVEPAGDGASTVSIVTEFTQTRQFVGYPAFRVACDSTGAVERGLVAHLRGRGVVVQ